MNFHCLLRLPDRQWELLHSLPLSTHFKSSRDSLCFGPARRRNCCHKLHRNVFHWDVQSESHQHHWKPPFYQGDAFSVIQIASQQQAYAEFIQLLWWTLTQMLFFEASLPLRGFTSRARATAGATTLRFPLQFHQRPLAQVVRWNGLRHGWSSGQHHSGPAAERIMGKYSLGFLNRYVPRIYSNLHSDK